LYGSSFDGGFFGFGSTCNSRRSSTLLYISEYDRRFSIPFTLGEFMLHFGKSFFGLRDAAFACGLCLRPLPAAYFVRPKA
jgi:hypothetical protein